MTAIIFLIILVSIALAAWALYSFFIGRVEKVPYKVEKKSKEYEIRVVKEHLVAETEVTGGYQEAGNNAFRILADYIFGNNKRKQKIAMTTPVISAESEKIAMTAPVISEESETAAKKVAFVLPEKFNMENVPDPVDKRVKIKKIPKKKIAALRYSGRFTDNTFEKKKKQLIGYLNKDKIKFEKIYSARYSPPMTPALMVRNEVWAELSK